MFKLST